MNLKLKTFFFVFFVALSNASVAQITTDSLLGVIPKLKNEEKVDALISLSLQYLGSDNQKAKERGLQALKLSDSLGYSFGATEAAYYIGVIEFYQSNFDSTLLWINKTHEYAVKNNDSAYIARVLTMQGVIYDEFAEHEKATQKYLEAMKIFESVNDEDGMAACRSNIGLIYFKQGEHYKAIEYIEKSMETEMKLKEYVKIAGSYITLGDIYKSLKQNKKSLEYYKKSVENCKKVGDNQTLSKAYNSIGAVYLSTEQYANANNYFNDALSLKKGLNDLTGQSKVLNNLGKLYTEKNEFQKAKESLTEALQLAKSIEAKPIIRDIYLEFYSLYSSMNEHKKALENYLMYNELKDSIDKKMHNDKLYRQQTLFDTEQKDKEIKLLNAENKAKNEQIKRQKTINYLQVAVLILFIVVAFLVFRMYKKKKNTAQILEKQNKYISEQSDEIKSQNEQLEAQTKKLQELDELKSQFFANISHEFRTPLTLILGPAEQMLQNNANSNELAMIIRHAKRLKQLIDQLLEISKIEKGALKLNPVKSDFSVFVRTMVGSFESWAVERQLRLNFNSKPESFEACFDKDKMEKVFNNLVSNAIKFSEAKSSIDVDLQLIDDTVQLKVRDHGKGIAQKHLKNIFDRFYRIEGQDNSVGTGIGLSLTKELVQLHGGTIQVESETGKGTTFIVTIPVKQEIGAGQEFQETHLENPKNVPVKEVAESTLLANTEKETKTTGKSVLIVEDNADMQKYIASCLKGYEIHIAENGEKGIEKAKEINPDLIVSDVMMPVMDGYEMTKKVKNNELLSHIPIIMLTAKASEESLLEGFECEADDYLTKPFSANELNARIKSQIKNREKLIEKFRKNISVSPSEISTTSADEFLLKKALKIVEENMDKSDFSVEDFVKEVGMSRTNLHRKLKALTGLSTTEFIRSIRLKRAAQLIKDNVGNVSEIAYQVGFTNLSYFTRCFKEEFKCLPSEFRD